MKIYFVFDVESLGLHGDAFAVGWTVVREDRKELGSGLLALNPGHKDLMGDQSDRAWVEVNCAKLEVNCKYPDMLRNGFWVEWIKWKDQGAIMVSDCAWPVEARFLAWCVDFDTMARKFDGPYPLVDVSSILLAKGVDPTKTFDRLPSELPIHHPLNDARQSARILLTHLHPHDADTPARRRKT